MINPESIAQAAGYIGIFGVIFAESGLLIGFFLPGDSLLFTVGFFAAQGLFGFSLIPLALGCFAAAVLGDSVGYSFGLRVGPRIFRRPNSLLFSTENVRRAEVFYKKHGGKTIILARFVPVVRTFAPILAGVGKMTYGQFFLFNLIGGFLWAVGLTSLGYGLGNVVGAERYVELMVLGIVVLSIAPAIYHLLRNCQKRMAARAALKRERPKPRAQTKP